MKIGMITDSLPDADFDTMLGVAARLEMDMLEFGCGNWSSAPHLKLDRLLESADARREFRARLKDHGIAISALNCSGNPVHPGEVGRRHDAVTRKTIRLARLLEVDRVVMMSGCPGAPGDSHANWVTTEWPPEVRDILRWQWEVVLVPYWRDLVAFSNAEGIHRLCLELHGHQNVYSVATLKRLRDAVGETVGANLDPSHLMWMGADPLNAARALGSAIYYVHAKDTRIEPSIAGVNGVIDTTPGSEYGSRAWNYITLGYGHDEAWWRSFVAALGAAGYDGVLSIEHEDPAMSAVEGVEKSVELLRRVIGKGPARHALGGGARPSYRGRSPVSEGYARIQWDARAMVTRGAHRSSRGVGREAGGACVSLGRDARPSEGHPPFIEGERTEEHGARAYPRGEIPAWAREAHRSSMGRGPRSGGRARIPWKRYAYEPRACISPREGAREAHGERPAD